MNATTIYVKAREIFDKWESDLKQNCFTQDADYVHTIQFYLSQQSHLLHELETFGDIVVKQLESLVAQNNQAHNLPRLESYNAFGEPIDAIIHHPSYIAAGELIYQTGLLAKLTEAGGLSACLSFLFLSSQAGEAGHNCPIACSAGIIRVLQLVADFPEKNDYLQKLTTAAFQTSFSGAQFLTEIQGGSDVGQNQTIAIQDTNNQWRISGEKWFCSNAGADLFFVTARYSSEISGTKGLGLFLIPAKWQNKKNQFRIRRLKDKLGTRSMATGEIDFNEAYALPMGLADGFQLAMHHVLHLSRLFNTICVLGMARRALTIAFSYAKHRIAFSKAIIDYPLVQENLAIIKAENMAMVAGVFATAHQQDIYDQQHSDDQNQKLLLRLLVNLQKYLSAKLSVNHIHHALDVLAGNGTIETFSSLPRLLRDCIICENWEGTHNVLREQIHRDILKYEIDQIYLTFMRKKISDISDSDEQIRWQFKCDELQKELIAFREMNNELQSLQIRFIVDQLALYFCGLMLYFEAEHQTRTEKSIKKRACYEYFYMIKIDKNKLTVSDQQLKLIQSVLF